MFGRKPQTYQQVARMKVCQVLQAKFPSLTEEQLEQIYSQMERNPAETILVTNNGIQLMDTTIPLELPPDQAAFAFHIANSALYYHTPVSRDSSYDGGVSGNNNNNNNNNNNA